MTVNGLVFCKRCDHRRGGAFAAFLNLNVDVLHECHANVTSSTTLDHNGKITHKLHDVAYCYRKNKDLDCKDFKLKDRKFLF